MPCLWGTKDAIVSSHLCPVPRLFATVLLLCLLLPIGGGWLWLRLEKQQAKREAQQFLLAQKGDNALTRLAFTRQQAEHQLHWEHASEFEWQGRMYDVVHLTRTRDSLLLWCWPDDNETTLNRQLADLSLRTAGLPARNAQREQVHLLLKSLFLPPIQGRFLSSQPDNQPVRCGNYADKAIGRAKTILLPPPR